MSDELKTKADSARVKSQKPTEKDYVVFGRFPFSPSSAIFQWAKGLGKGRNVSGVAKMSIGGFVFLPFFLFFFRSFFSFFHPFLLFFSLSFSLKVGLLTFSQGDLWEHRKLPQRSPNQNRIWCIIALKYEIWGCLLYTSPSPRDQA